MAVDLYSNIPTGYGQRVPVEKQKLPLNYKKVRSEFRSEIGPWFFTLMLSLLPVFIVFFLFRGPERGFAFLEFFNNDALLYIFVTMSALSLFTYGIKNFFGVVNFFIMFLCMVVYFLLTSNVCIPLFKIYDRREFIAWAFLLSVLTGLLTLVYSSVKKGKK